MRGFIKRHSVKNYKANTPWIVFKIKYQHIYFNENQSDKRYSDNKYAEKTIRREKFYGHWDCRGPLSVASLKPIGVRDHVAIRELDSGIFIWVELLGQQTGQGVADNGSKTEEGSVKTEPARDGVDGAGVDESVEPNLPRAKVDVAVGVRRGIGFSIQSILFR